MQILFEDLTLDEAKILVDALEHHRQLQTKLEIEAEEEMAKRREALERVIYGENEGRAFRNTNPENGLEGHWITKAYPAAQGKEMPAEDIYSAYTSAVLAQHLSNPEVQGDLEACGQQGNRLGKLLAEEFGRELREHWVSAGPELSKKLLDEYDRYVEQTGDLDISFEDWYAAGKPCGFITLSEEAREALERLNTLSIAELIATGDLEPLDDCAKQEYARWDTGCSTSDPQWTWPVIRGDSYGDNDVDNN